MLSGRLLGSGKRCKGGILKRTLPSLTLACPICQWSFKDISGSHQADPYLWKFLISLLDSIDELYTEFSPVITENTHREYLDWEIRLILWPHPLETYVIIKKSLKKPQYLKIEKISFTILYLLKGKVDINKEKDLVVNMLVLVLINYASRWDI